MFKYIWLIMIVFAVVAFIAYTVYCCYQASKDAASLKEWYDNMEIDHEGLIPAWTSFFIIGIIILFIASLIMFTSHLG